VSLKVNTHNLRQSKRIASLLPDSSRSALLSSASQSISLPLSLISPSKFSPSPSSTSDFCTALLNCKHLRGENTANDKPSCISKHKRGFNDGAVSVAASPGLLCAQAPPKQERAAPHHQLPQKPFSLGLALRTEMFFKDLLYSAAEIKKKLLC
jgi:hypothetical protein